MAIFDHSWYTHVLHERVEGQVSERECREAFRDILDFERALSDDGCVIVKFWLHISRKEQKKRFEALARDPLENWRITEEDWKRHKKYDEYLLAAEEMLEWTESECGPWTIVEATSRWHTRRRVFETAIRALEHRLGSKAPPAREPSEDDERDRQLREEHQALDPAEAGS
jgi:polyphosphate kinase 2 (PPK2 family)